MRVFVLSLTMFGFIAACGARPPSAPASGPPPASSVTLPPAEKPEDKRPAEIRRYLVRFYTLATRHKAILKTFTITDDFSSSSGDALCEVQRLATMLAAMRAGDSNGDAVNKLSNLGISLAGYQLEQETNNPGPQLDAYERQLEALEKKLSDLQQAHAGFRQCRFPLIERPYKPVF